MNTKRKWRDKELLRFEEVMEIIDVKSRQTIYNLLSKGKLKAHNAKGKPGGRGIRILSSSVEEYLNDGIIPADAWSE